MSVENFKEIMKLATSESKNGMYGKNGENAVNGQSVYMLDDDKNIVKEFKSVRLAMEHIGTKGHSALMKACREGSKYKGYYWNKTYKNYV